MVMSGTLVMSGPGHPNSHGPFLAPCWPQYVPTGFFCKKPKKIDIFPNRATLIETFLEIY